MKQYLIQGILALLFLILLTVYYVGIIPDIEIDLTFLPLSTFLFALVTGFFIARQSTRYSEIRKLTARFDGVLTMIYRTLSYFGEDAQRGAATTIQKHYRLVREHEWDYHLRHKSDTLKELYHHLGVTTHEQGLDGIKNHAANRMVAALYDAQRIRKHMVALHDERIPGFQQTLIYILMTILLIMVSTIPSAGLFLGSLIKAAFVIAVIVVVILLRQLDQLQLYSNAVGARSANDVLEILEGEK